MPNKKYTLTDETKEINGVTVHRIKALRDIGPIAKGSEGGWLEKEANLSKLGDSWVMDDAVVFDKATVSGNALVFGNATVSGHASVFGNATVSENATVTGEARVCGNAKVFSSIKLTKGLFFGVRWNTDTEIKEMEITDGHYLVYKGVENENEIYTDPIKDEHDLPANLWIAAGMIAIPILIILILGL